MRWTLTAWLETILKKEPTGELYMIKVKAKTKQPKRKCDYCGYVWRPRVDAPKRCPRCSRWIVYWIEGDDA
jgi:predicted Zn-ribbon and HTH transcriptional regulator